MTRGLRVAAGELLIPNLCITNQLEVRFLSASLAFRIRLEKSSHAREGNQHQKST